MTWVAWTANTLLKHATVMSQLQVEVKGIVPLSAKLDHLSDKLDVVRDEQIRVAARLASTRP